MNCYFPGKATARLDAKLAFVKGKGSQKLANAIAGEIAEGNDFDRLNGQDRHGRPQPPVKKRRGKYAGATGPPTAPFGAASRVVTGFRSQPRKRGGVWRIIAGWEGVVSRSGFPFLLALNYGVKAGAGRMPKPRGNVFARAFQRIKLATIGGWFIPPRPIFGISPRTWKRINKRIDEFRRDIKRGK